ncbi:hypothetical protein MJO29_016609, partial [Puccinia striiformis f. sp. tritici]
CIKQTITIPDGKAIHGSWVHPSTCCRHWAQNLTPQDNHRIPVSALPAIPPQDETSPASEPDSGPANTLSEVESITSVTLTCADNTNQSFAGYIYYFTVWLSCIFQKLPCDHTRYSESYKESQTITEHLGLDPEIESSICCPKCFRLYKHEDALTICVHHRSKKAQVCREGLFKTNANKLLPGYQAVPLIRQPHYPPLFKPFTSCLVYHTQPFNSWLKWFLNVAGIEDKIFAWREKVKSITDNRIADIQRCKAWRSFWFCTKREPACNKLCLTWEDVFPAALFSTRIHASNSSRFSPFELLYGVKPRLPQDCQRMVAAEPVLLGYEDLQTCIANLNHTRTTATSNMAVRALKNKNVFDKNTVFAGDLGNLVAGQLVKLRNEKHSKGDPRWFGPFTITKVLDNNVYIIANHQGVEYPRPVNGNSLKPVALRLLMGSNMWATPPAIAQRGRHANARVARDLIKKTKSLAKAEKMSAKDKAPVNSEVPAQANPAKPPARRLQLLSCTIGTMASYNIIGASNGHLNRSHPSISLTTTISMTGRTINLATFRQAFIFRTTHSQTFKQPCLTLSSLNEWHSLFLTYLPLNLINFFVDNPAKCATGNNQNLLLNFLSLVICTNIVSLNSIYNSNSNKLVFDLQKIGPNHHYALHLPKQMK